MPTQLIDGTALAKTLRAALRERVAVLTARGVRPGLAVLLVGDDAASHVYVRNKARACEEVGVHSEVYELAGTSSESEVLARVDALNHEPRIHGILVQLPLPKHIAPHKVIESIAPEKDVDGFGFQNAGALMMGAPRFVPCTPAGVMVLLEHEGVDPWGRHAVVVGASNIVGKPMAMLLLQKGATVTICNSKTRDLGAITRQADILVAAVGRPKLVTGDMIKPGAVVIDVGITRLPDGKLTGDVDFAAAQGVAARITPVPGGVGPMTITMLIANTLTAAQLISGIDV